MTRGLTRGVLVLLSVVAGASLQAQQAPRRVQSEVRVDAIAARDPALHLGVGATVPTGTYVRVGAVAGAGATMRNHDTRFSGRVDLLARFVLDPLLQFRRAPYAAGGVSALYVDGQGSRFVLLFAVGVEGAPRGGLVPAAELGLGGGVRVALVLRRAIPGRR